ncbi:MAG: tRNA epoxyqueuosine(34) reductase QueG [Vicinamibacterales bacterium]
MTSAAIKAHAATLGFDLCGIAPADPIPELALFDDWLARGYAGNMAWLVRTAEKRKNLQLVVPGARSVIVLGTIYNTDRPYSTEVAKPGAAVISRYAWGDDYHDVLKARLRRLHDWMYEVEPPPFEARYYADTGPVQERVFAQYAGLGWIGKHACVINERLGSWFFLSVIVTTLALEPDARGVDQCGTCTLCIEACPTQAIVEPRVVDSTRCVSYLTIEERGDIPEELRPGLANRVYGCDVCQDVCPFNHAPAVSGDPHWQPRPGLDGATAAQLWRTSDTALLRLTKGSAMKHAKLPMLRRNLALALQVSGSQDDRAALAEPAEDRPSADGALVQRHIRIKA